MGTSPAAATFLSCPGAAAWKERLEGSRQQEVGGVGCAGGWREGGWENVEQEEEVGEE